MNNEIEKNTQIIEARAEQLAERIEALVVEARRFFLTFSKSATPQRILAAGENSATVQRKDFSGVRCIETSHITTSI